jgi:hypothetical protein
MPGYSAPFKAEAFNKHKDYLDWRMEDGDSQILAYLYRNHQPSRHLEFGTWEDSVRSFARKIATRKYGRSTCMKENGQAKVCRYTVTRRLWETNSRKASWFLTTHQLSRPMLVIGSAGAIGRRGYTKRVRQILVDSTTWDASSFADGFFDSILIDGGHASDVVISDTNTSLRLLRTEGCCYGMIFVPPTDRCVILRPLVASLTHFMPTGTSGPENWVPRRTHVDGLNQNSGHSQ